MVEFQLVEGSFVNLCLPTSRYLSSFCVDDKEMFFFRYQSERVLWLSRSLAVVRCWYDINWFHMRYFISNFVIDTSHTTAFLVIDSTEIFF